VNTAIIRSLMVQPCSLQSSFSSFTMY